MCFVPDLSPDSSSYEYNSLFSLEPDFDDAVAVQSKPLVVEIKLIDSVQHCATYSAPVHRFYKVCR
jgi:hypothetical protein